MFTILNRYLIQPWNDYGFVIRYVHEIEFWLRPTHSSRQLLEFYRILLLGIVPCSYQKAHCKEKLIIHGKIYQIHVPKPQLKLS